jgi:hypothetical protein
VVCKPISAGGTSWVNSADYSVKTSGVTCPFRSDLSLPDTNFVGDIISKYFLEALGSSIEEQIDTLATIRSCLGNIRMTRVGDEIAHFYRCVQLAIDSKCGLRTAFTGSTYDGSILSGGTGAYVFIGQSVMTFDEPEIVNDDIRRLSLHSTALNEISSMFPAISQAGVRSCTSMVELRNMCLSNSFTQDNVSIILAKARDLDFGKDSWAVTPENLRSCFRIMCRSLPLTPDVPIGRGSLFSKDMVTVGLSVFREGDVPSWNIPSGTLRKLTGKGSPSPPSQRDQKRLASGGVDDGPWVMETRGAKLEDAVEDFKSMAIAGGYRSIPSAQARKQHYKVYAGARIDVFWKDMQDAYGSTNSAFKAEDRDDSATVGRSSPGTLQGGPSKKRRVL